MGANCSRTNVSLGRSMPTSTLSDVPKENQRFSTLACSYRANNVRSCMDYEGTINDAIAHLQTSLEVKPN